MVSIGFNWFRTTIHNIFVDVRGSIDPKQRRRHLAVTGLGRGTLVAAAVVASRDPKGNTFRWLCIVLKNGETVNQS